MAVDVWEWLSLIDSDGPFLSRAALKSFYPSGLPKSDASVDDVNATFVDEFVRWSTAWSTSPSSYPAARDRWIEAVLRKLLNWSDDLKPAPTSIAAHSPNESVAVTPWASLTADIGPAALVTVVDHSENLRSVGTDGWSANAIDRMAALLRETGTTIGIVTDGRWWALVSAAKDVTTASGVWDALLWREERPSRDAFLALASFTSIAGGLPEKRLPLLFEKSVASAEQITEALGDQVRRAVELVLQSMSDTHLRAIAQGDESPLPRDPKAVYEAAVTMLMRIVFLLFAEERGLLPEHDLYRSSYAIAGLREQLQREATATSLESLDHSWEAWHRVLAASTAVYGGASYEDMRMPAYGGSLFDPDRFPWLQTTDAQGRLAVRLTDRAMLAVLRAVQTIEDGAMQLSFRDLDVEQIGYVYEGLLGYSAVYVDEVTVGLEGKSGFEPEIPIRELEAIAEASSTSADFGRRLAEHLKKTQEHAKPRTANQLAKAYGTDDQDAAADARTRLRHALLGDDELAGRLEPFHALIRVDLRGFPYVVPTKGLVMTESPQRANTGTHYTPRSLAEEVVLHALEPLVYSPGPLDTENSDEWVLKSSAEILDLKVADIAAGSGAFLVAAARYLADRLIEARSREGLEVGAESDIQRWAVREIVARCLYGADINGMAVEMCKLSLWLISMDPAKPFSFVDDRVFHGNSLLGVTTEAQLKAQHIYPQNRTNKATLRWFNVDKDLEDAARLRRELASGQVDDADRMRSTRAKRGLLTQAEQATAKLRDVADGIVAVALLEGGLPGRRLEEQYDNLADALLEAYPLAEIEPDRRRLDAIIANGLTPTVDTGESRWNPLHWIIEAPDVFNTHGGFDAIIGNPPFLGGSKITGANGTNYRNFLVSALASGRTGNADLISYFLLRTDALVTPEGMLGLIATNTLAQGSTREVGLDQMESRGYSLVRASRSKRWPAKSANLEYAAIWATRAPLASSFRGVVDDLPVYRISTLLEPIGRIEGFPVPLRENAGIAFEGFKPYGRGFIVEKTDAMAWIVADSRNSDVVFPYLNGEDLNGEVDQTATRWIVNFKDWPQERASQYALPFERLTQAVKLDRQKTTPAGAFVFPPAMRERWWQYEKTRPAMVQAIGSLNQVIAMAKVSATLMPALVSAKQVLDAKLVVFASDSRALLSILSSTMHRSFAIKYGTTMRTDATYTPRTVFEPFPLPPLTPELEELGELLLARQMLARDALGLGNTALYNRVNSPSDATDLVQSLRDVHQLIDVAVASAYGWQGIDLELGFHEYRGVRRLSFRPNARVEILDRVLEENHRRAAIEARSVPTYANRVKGLAESEQPEGAMF